MSRQGTKRVPLWASGLLKVAVEKSKQVSCPPAVHHGANPLSFAVFDFIFLVLDLASPKWPKRIPAWGRRRWFGQFRPRLSEVVFLTEFKHLRQFLGTGPTPSFPTSLRRHLLAKPSGFKFLFVFHVFLRTLVSTVVMRVNAKKFLGRKDFFWGGLSATPNADTCCLPGMRPVKGQRGLALRTPTDLCKMGIRLRGVAQAISTSGKIAGGRPRVPTPVAVGGRICGRIGRIFSFVDVA